MLDPSWMEGNQLKYFITDSLLFHFYSLKVSSYIFLMFCDLVHNSLNFIMTAPFTID